MPSLHWKIDLKTIEYMPNFMDF